VAGWALINFDRLASKRGDFSAVVRVAVSGVRAPHAPDLG
jgi:hypothetical protein